MMKKIIMTAAFAACAAVVTAQTVTSANIVGYTKVDVVGGELTLAALNFETSGAMLSELIPQGTLPNGSSVFMWNKDTEGYATATVNTRGSWVGDRALALGDALWIQAAGTDAHEIIFSGEVLTTDAVIEIPAGVVATGYFFPVEKDLKTSDIAVAVANGSSIFLWDEATQGYATWNKNTRGSWVGTGDPIVAPKQGFWVDNAGEATTVTETVPFTP